MPDIDFQKIELNLIPKKGDEPVIFYASQYETARPFIADLKWGTTEFAPGDDCYAEIDIRKNDNNLVVITDDVAIDNNEVSVILPVQALTCIGNNLGQVKIYAADDQLIAALNFILEVQPDPLAGGVDSETAIDNLESQIAAIVPEVIGDMTQYYTKSEVDALIDDIFPTFTASGAIASFTTALNKHLVSVTAEVGATAITRCGVNLWNGDSHDGKGMGGTGTEYTDPASFATLFVPVVPGTTIYLNPTNWRHWINWYKADQTFLSQSVVDSNNEITVPVGAAYARFTGILAEKATAMVCFASQKTEPYAPYNGHTVPIADATSLTTLSGVNNVFADSGDVTVQYKYMSM